jgi:capsular exopolysaccharide synthesis family protein
MARILADFKVGNRPKTDIIDIGYVGFEPNQATRVANAMAQAYQIYNTTSAQQFSRRRKAFLEKQVRQADSVLMAANGELISFRSGRMSSVAAAAAQTTAATQAETDRMQLQSEQQALEAVLSQVQNRENANPSTIRALASAPAIMGNPVIQQLFTQLVSQEQVRDDMKSAGAAPTNPDLVTANTRIAATQARLLDAVQSQKQSVDARLASIRGGRSGGIAIASIPAGDTREAQLAQDVATAQKLAGDLKEELQKAQMAEAVEAGQVEIVQLSHNPGVRVTTGAGRKVFLGLLVGLMFGFGAAVLIDNLDKRIRKRGEIEPLLGVPGLVVIPRLASAATPRIPGLRSLPGRSPQRAHRKDDQTLDLVTVTDPRSTSAEAFRTLRTNLMFSQAVNAMRTLVVTSASPGEGKTVTAANLAVAFAQQGMRVLLIDCDLRRGRMHRMFNVPREPGMSDLVLGFAKEEDVTRETSVPGLYVIPSGKLPPNPAEMLGGENAHQQLTRLTEGYDLIIIDTPPLLAASDAAILARLSDGVIMVLRAGATETTAAQQATQQLNNLGARIVGAVLNDPDAQVARYGAYYQYDYTGAEA